MIPILFRSFLSHFTLPPPNITPRQVIYDPARGPFFSPSQPGPILTGPFFFFVRPFSTPLRSVPSTFVPLWSKAFFELSVVCGSPPPLSSFFFVLPTRILLQISSCVDVLLASSAYSPLLDIPFQQHKSPSLIFGLRPFNFFRNAHPSRLRALSDGPLDFPGLHPPFHPSRCPRMVRTTFAFASFFYSFSPVVVVSSHSGSFFFLPSCVLFSTNL